MDKKGGPSGSRVSLVKEKTDLDRSIQALLNQLRPPKKKWVLKTLREMVKAIK
jgi:predicted site-specific integrase-resolvase